MNYCLAEVVQSGEYDVPVAILVRVGFKIYDGKRSIGLGVCKGYMKLAKEIHMQNLLAFIDGIFAIPDSVI